MIYLVFETFENGHGHTAFATREEAELHLAALLKDYNCATVAELVERDDRCNIEIVETACPMNSHANPISRNSS